MLPLGHPVPPETTFTILNAGGGVERFCGRAEATATTATTGSTNFMLECLVPEKWTRYVFANNPFSGSPQTHRPSYILPPTPHTHYCPEQNNHLLKVQTEPSPRAIYAHHSPSTTCICRIGRQAGSQQGLEVRHPPGSITQPSTSLRSTSPLVQHAAMQSTQTLALVLRSHGDIHPPGTPAPKRSRRPGRADNGRSGVQVPPYNAPTQTHLISFHRKWKDSCAGQARKQYNIDWKTAVEVRMYFCCG